MSNEFLNVYIVISITNTKVDGGFVVKYFKKSLKRDRTQPLSEVNSYLILDLLFNFFTKLHFYDLKNA